MARSGFFLQNETREFAAFIARCDAAEYLTPERERQLFAAVEQGSGRARDAILEAHFRFAVSLAKPYALNRANVKKGIKFSDLVSAGMEGLVESIDKFEPARGYRFCTYAQWWIAARLREFVMRNSSHCKIPTTPKAKDFYYNCAVKRQELEYLGVPAHEMAGRLAAELGMTVQELEMFQSTWSGTVSLDAPVRDDVDGSVSFADIVADPAMSVEDRMADQDELDHNVARLREVLAQMSDRESDILRSRRLMEEAVTLEALSTKYNVSRERIRQIEVKAFEKLQLAMAA